MSTPATPAAAAASFADVDVGCWIGPYPFRHVPHPDPDVLVRVLAREGIAGGWVGWLPSAFQRDPAPGNEALTAALAPFAPTLRAAPAVRPDWPGWERVFARAIDDGAAAIRAYPAQHALGDAALARLAGACAETSRPLLLQVRFEDLRQRHVHDVAGDLAPATVRRLARAGTGAALVVLGAGREFVEEVAWGLTPTERARVWFDYGWLWGPPEDQLATLIGTLGAERFTVATHWPLRLTQQSRALWSLLPDALRSEKPTSGLAIAGSGSGTRPGDGTSRSGG